MSVNFNSLRSLFYGSANTNPISFNDLRPASSVTLPNQGVPRYAKRANGTDIPSSGPISFHDFLDPKFDLGTIAFHESRGAWGVVSGWRAPSHRAFNTWGGAASVEGAWAVFRWNGYTVKVSTYWSGGATNIYGQIIRNASFRYFYVDITHPYSCYAIVGRYDYNSCGYSNTNGMSGDMSTANRSVTIVCKNRV